MSESLAASMDVGQRDYSVHLRQLRATDSFVEMLQEQLHWHVTPKDVTPERVVPERTGKAVLRIRGNTPVISTSSQIQFEVVQTASSEVIEGPVEPFRFFDLPYELREKVYEHAVEQYHGVFLPAKNGHQATGPPCPDIARTGNAQFDQEATLVNLKRTTISIHSGPGNTSFQAWLSEVDFSKAETSLKDGFGAVHTLQFPYFSRFPYHIPEITTNNDIRLMQRCPNLRHVTISFVSDELVARQA